MHNNAINLRRDEKIRCKTIFIFFTIHLLLISFSGINIVKAENEVKIALSTDTQTLIPGKINTIKFTLKNNGDLVARSLTVTINMPATSQIQESVMYVVNGDGTHFLADLDPGESVNVTEGIYVNPKTANSVVSIQVKMNYQVPDETEEYRNVGFTISSLSSTGAKINVSTSTSNLLAGNSNTLILYLKNSGDSIAYNVDITMGLPGVGGFSPLTFIDSDGNWLLESINVNATNSIPIKIFASPSSAGSTYLISLTVSYSDSIRQWQVTRYISVGIPYPLTKGAILDVTLNDQNLASGTVNERSITIQNSGDEKARNISFSLSTPNTQSFAIIGSDRWSIDSIEPGQSVKIPVKFFITASSSGVTYSIPASLNYLDNLYKQKQENIGLSVIIFGNVVIDVLESSTYPSTVVQGKPFSITATIINLGTTTAQSVTVLPKANSDMQPSSSSTIFIGDLSTNVPSSITITYVASNIKNQTYPVEVDYSYRLSTSQKFTGKITIPVKITATNKVILPIENTPQSQSPSTLGQYASYAVIMVLVVIIAYMYVKRRALK
jgi:hypothetical protein